MSTNGHSAPLTVVGLYGENVKRVKVVEIRPAAQGVVTIAGANDQGKSSTLDLIEMALGGKDVQPRKPIREGATKAKAVVDLGEYRITRTWTDKDSYLTVEQRGQKAPMKKPQDFLDAIVGSGLGFDPMDFVRLKADKQVVALLDLLKLPEDPRTLDASRKKLYDERTIVNRDVDTITVKLRGMEEPSDDVPDEELSLARLTEEHGRLSADIKAYDDAERNVREAAAATQRARDKVVELEAMLAKAREAVKAAESSEAHAVGALAQKARPSLDDVVALMAAAQETNEKVRQKKARAVVAAELTERQRVAADLTAAIRALDDKKRRVLSEAPFPIAGLGFEEVAGGYCVTFNGIPLDQSATSVQIRVGMAIAMAMNPTVRVILLRDASLLDAATMDMVRDMVHAEGFQVWAEIVGPGGGDAFVIEDGGVLSGPAPAAPVVASPVAGVEW